MPYPTVHSSALSSAATRLGVAGLAVAAVLLTGCSGSTPATTAGETPAAGASSAAAPSQAATPEASPSASPSATTAPADLPKAAQGVCAVIGLKDMEKLLDVDLAEAKPQNEADGSLCTYGPTDAGRTLAVALAGKSQGSLKTQAENFEKQVSDGKAETVKVAGMDEALLLSGSKDGANTVGLLARDGDYVFGTILAGPDSKSTLQDAAEEIVTTLRKA